MKFLSRNTDYAIRALMFIATKTPTLVSSAEMERDLNLPRPFLRKILQTLSKAGYLESVKGMNGGFRLVRTLESIALLDIITVFQGPILLKERLFRKDLCCCRETCLLRNEIHKVEDLVMNHLNGIKLAQLKQA